MNNNFFQWLSGIALTYGALGLGAGAMLESLGIPFASTSVDIAAGILIVKGRNTFLEIWLIVIIGKVIGSALAYAIGRYASTVFEERWPQFYLKMQNSKAKSFLESHGEVAIFFAQLFGPTRTWISYPAGTMQLKFGNFIIYSALGGALYFGVIISLSYAATTVIGEEIVRLLSLGSIRIVIGALLLIAALVSVLFFLKRRSAQKTNTEETTDQ